MWGINLMVQSKMVIRFIVGVSALVALTAPVAAELIVSGAAGIDSMKVGAKFSDDAVFKLPANSELILLRSPDNTPFIMHGPYEGTLSNYIANCSGYLATFRSYCHDSGGDRPPIGATRGLRPSN
jgi:hypothetical protein